MYLKSIEIQGFKSYGNKVVLKNLDTVFNAITGLNGTGKSNILDSICFVLGVSKLEQVRAKTFEDLVFNHGNSGITKAEVSLIFDNTDILQAPVGYTNVPEIKVTRMVSISGTKKYMLNGVAATRKTVQDFFQSVQLNINNPHFLIQQGRVTKILNMKPMEILSMLEEATGTRMLETKIHYAEELMDRKEKRFQEFEQMLAQAIVPQMENWKSKYESFVEYKQIKNEYDRLSKLIVAWQYTQTEQAHIEAEEALIKTVEDLKAVETNIKELKDKASIIQQDLNSLIKKKDKETCGKLVELEQVLRKKNVEETKVNNQLKNLKNQFTDDKRKLTELQNSWGEEKAILIQKEMQLHTLHEKSQKLESVCLENARSKEAAIQKLQDANSGIYTTDEGKSKTLTEQIIAAQEEISSAKTEETIAKKKLSFLEKSLKQQEADYAGTDEFYEKMQMHYKNVQNEIKMLQQTIENVNFDEKYLQNLENEKRKTEREIQSLQDIIDTINAKFPLLSFDYCDPVKQFDRSKVKGVVCTLFKIRDQSATTALEIAAGMKLFFVVVDDHSTAKLLLEHGKLKRRRTLIPLNKILTHPIPEETVQRAKFLVGEENIYPALSVIDYSQDMADAMEYVFGGIFISRDMESARKIAFDSGLNVKCVTLEGDVFDPAGVVSGGSLKHRPCVLKELAKMNSIEEKVLQKQQHSLHIATELLKVNTLREKYNALKENLSIKTNELENLKIRLESSTYHCQKLEIENAKISIVEQKLIIAKSEETIKRVEDTLGNLMEMKKNSNFRAQKIKEANDVVDSCQKNLELSEKEFDDCKQKLEQSTLDIDAMKQSLKDYETQINELCRSIKSQESEMESTEEENKTKKKAVEEATEDVKALKGVLKAHNREIVKLENQLSGMKRETNNLILRKHQLELDKTKCQTDVKESKHKVHQFVEKHIWVEDQKKYFGVPKTEYDFTNFDERQSMARYKELDEKIEHLSKVIVPRAQTVYETAEQKYQDIIMRKDVIQKEKKGILKVIEKLTDKKQDAVRDAFKIVNHDLQTIFATLLPGAKVCLVPYDGDDILNGLQFRVGFGNIWKESLAELSGGQRIFK